jgi:hypothetical protein
MSGPGMLRWERMSEIDMGTRAIAVAELEGKAMRTCFPHSHGILFRLILGAALVTPITTAAQNRIDQTQVCAQRQHDQRDQLNQASRDAKEKYEEAKEQSKNALRILMDHCEQKNQTIQKTN